MPDVINAPEPELADVLQEEHPEPIVVPVEVAGPVRTHELPAPIAVYRSLSITNLSGANTTPEMIGPDPRRKRLILLSEAEAFYFGTDTTTVRSGAAGKWPAGVPLVLTYDGTIYVRSAGATDTLTVCGESWAE